MKTQVDLFQIYRTEFGKYPNQEEYIIWLEEKAISQMNTSNNPLPRLTEAERQLEILDRQKSQKSSPSLYNTWRELHGLPPTNL
jgi:hypothetical protein